tara:strand:+ start:2312 stop:4090 length:1779 start_codon:yes stop_codon:yes gene_type:complete
MGILRVDKISGLENPTAVTGSVEFDGNDNLSIGNAGDFNFLHQATQDWTAEFWSKVPSNSRQFVFGTGASSAQTGFSFEVMTASDGQSSQQGVFAMYGRGSAGNYRYFGANNVLTLNTWHHIAAVFKASDKTLTIYVDGKEVDSDTGTANGSFGTGDYSTSDSSYAFTVAKNIHGSTYLTGDISNLRVVSGRRLYTSEFTPPVHALEPIDGTRILCCNNPDSVTAVSNAGVGTAHIATVGGNPTVSTDNPGLIRDFTSGTEFRGVTTFDTQGYFVPPSGTTEQRYNDVAKNAVSASSARGLFGGGNAPSKVNTIEYITISTTGNGTNFGDLTNTPAQAGGVASNTRGIVGGGYDGSARTNVINYLTVAATGNAQDFGDLITGRSGLGALSSTTRAVWSGGYGTAVVNTMDYVTIASTGNAQDFGDLLGTNNEMTGCASPTRGIFGSGDVPGDGTLTNTLQYITTSTLGNSQDFGDLTIAADYSTGFSNSTRGIFYIGYTPNPASNIINFITISSTGNAVDFGDAYEKSGARSTTGASSSTRGVVAGGDSPAKSNSIEYVTIASLGNGQDFGALANFDTASPFGLSNGHGGLG